MQEWAKLSFHQSIFRQGTIKDGVDAGFRELTGCYRVLSVRCEIPAANMLTELSLFIDTHQRRPEPLTHGNTNSRSHGAPRYVARHDGEPRRAQDCRAAEQERRTGTDGERSNRTCRVVTHMQYAH
jgi:hypothetical protein